MTAPPTTWPAAFRDLLSHGMTEVLLASTASGVVLPEYVRQDDDVTCLQYGDRASRDLDVNDDGIAALLSFGGVPVNTFVPWSAVFVIRLADESRGFAALPIGVDGGLVICPIDPKRMIVVNGGPTPSETPAPTRVRHLGSVPMTEAPEGDTEEIPRGRPALRVVN